MNRITRDAGATPLRAVTREAGATPSSAVERDAGATPVVYFPLWRDKTNDVIVSRAGYLIFVYINSN